MSNRTRSITLTATLAGAALIVALAVWLSFGADIAVRAPGAHPDEDPFVPSPVTAAPPADDAVFDSPPKARAPQPPTTARRSPRIAHIRVVMASTGEPVPGAKVMFMPDHGNWPGETQTLQQTIETAGEVTFADANGTAVIRRAPYGATVLASHAGLFGHKELTHAEPRGGFVVALYPDRAVTVFARRSDGSPAADLQLAIRASPAYAPDETALEQVFARTDHDGRAVLPHAQTYDRSSMDVPLANWQVYAAEPGLSNTRVSLDLADPLAREVVLTLPPCGSAEVHLLDSFGVRAPISYSSITGQDLADHAAQLRHGTAWFPYVPCEGAWSLSVWSWAGFVEENLGSPTFDKEVVRLTVKCQHEGMALDGRLTGLPQPLPDVALLFGTSGEQPIQATARIGPDGSFRVVLPQGTLAGPLRARMIFPDGNGQDLDVPMFATLPEITPSNALHVDIGELPVSPLPVSASGRLIGDDPLPYVILRVHGDHDDDENARVPQSSHVRIDEDGTFVVHSLMTGAMRLEVRAIGCEAVPEVRFESGTRDLRVELRPAAELNARLLLPPGDLNLAVELRIGPYEWQPLEARREHESVSFGARELAAGTYSLRVRLRGVPDPIVQIDDISLIPGQRCADSRLDPIDLRDLVRTVRLRLVDQAGQPVVDDARAWFGRTDRVRSEHMFVEDGILSVAARTGGTVDVILEGNRTWQPLRYTGAARDTDITIERAFDAMVELTIEPPTGPEWTWWSRLYRSPTTPTLPARLGCDDDWEPDGDITETSVARVNEPGEFLVVVGARNRTTGTSASRELTTPLVIRTAGRKRVIVPPDIVAEILSEASRVR